MPIIVEDGSLVANANSFVDRADYIAYAASIGVVIPDDVSADAELIDAAEFIAQHEANLKGNKVQRSQSAPFPRTGLVIDGWHWGSDEIPRNVILCQLAFALDVHAGRDLWNREVNPNLAVKKERFEGLATVDYAISEKTGQKLSRTSKGDALLSSLLNSNGIFNIPLERS